MWCLLFYFLFVFFIYIFIDKINKNEAKQSSWNLENVQLSSTHGAVVASIEGKGTLRIIGGCFVSATLAFSTNFGTGGKSKTETETKSKSKSKNDARFEADFSAARVHGADEVSLFVTPRNEVRPVHCEVCKRPQIKIQAADN